MRIFCTYLCDYKDRGDYYLSLMPYGITSIAAYLEKEGHEVILANLSSYGYIKGAELTVQLNPEAVAISIFSFNRTDSFKYIKELKKLNKKIVIIAGGQHPTFLHDEIIARYPEIDFIITGEGELALKELIDASFKNSPVILNAERIKDINTIPSPSSFGGRMIGINPAEQYKFIITSRGCPATCAYCSSPNFWKKKVTFRNPELIVDELKYLQNKYGIIYFSIRDDNFSLKKDRVMEFCRILDKSNLNMMWNCQARVDTIDEEMLIAMKKCGLEHIQFGVESGSEKILKIYDKNINTEKIQAAAALVRKVGVYLSFYIMAGMIGETESDILATRKLISKTQPHDVIISPVAFYPGTKIYTDSQKQGLIDDKKWFTSQDNGLYVTPKKNHIKYIRELAAHSLNVSSDAEYIPMDFSVHSSITGKSCWMNYLIEADYYIKKNKIKKVTNIYNSMIKNFPDNKWGYLRLSEIIINDAPEKALKLLKKVIKLSPSFFGAWFMLSLIHFKNGNISDAKETIQAALKINPYDSEIKQLAKKIFKTAKHK